LIGMHKQALEMLRRLRKGPERSYPIYSPLRDFLVAEVLDWEKQKHLITSCMEEYRGLRYITASLVLNSLENVLGASSRRAHVPWCMEMIKAVFI